jgi:outer membrane protein assembly factor BamA
MDDFSEESDIAYPAGNIASSDENSPEDAIKSHSGDTDEAESVASSADSLPARVSAGRETASVSEPAPGGGRPGEAELSRVVINEDSEEDVDPDTITARRERMKEKVGTVQDYKTKFSPDYVSNGMGVFYSTGFGFGFMNSIAFSDLLGDHRIHLSFNIHRSIEDSDILLSYYYLKRRIDYSFGVFHLKNYINSRVTSLGETFLDYRLFTERNYGIFSKMSYPFSTFTRVEFETQAYVLEREFFDNVGSYWYVPTGERISRRLIQPTISLVHDSAYYGNFGPVIGSRWMVSLSRSVNLSSDDISRSIAFYDYRKYIPVYYRNYLAFRAVGSVSTGEDSRYFFLGGPMTMRGYDYLQFQGSRMMLFNLEYRYPLVDALIFGWPGRWGIYNIGGTLFFDTGSVWGDDIYLERMPESIDPVVINDLDFYSDFGIGFYMRMGFLIFNFQLAWPTDFEDTEKPVFHFYLGPQF